MIEPRIYGIADILRKGMPEEQLEYGGANLPKIGAMVAMAGDGDHLDIGTGFGASAIMAAMVKVEYGYSGKVYCLDPYNLPPNQALPGRIASTMNVFNENAVNLNVASRIVLTPRESYPLPTDLKDRQYESVYLDGDKTGMMPWLDFLSVRGIVRKFIAFGGFMEIYPSVMTGALRALSVGGWILHYKDGDYIMFRRPIDVRDWPSLTDEVRTQRVAAMHS